MRRPLIAGNWKLHKTLAESTELASALVRDLADVTDVDIAIAPVFTALSSVAACLADSPIQLAAQNCYPEPSGAFTGEVSPSLLRDAGCRAVILGHSERRQLFGEGNVFVNRKVKSALASGLTAILCVGETLEERDGERMYDVLRGQVCDGLAGINAAAMSDVVIAYEPVWAIGTGRTASPEQAQEVHSFLRGLVSGLYDPDVAAAVRILYGGSVKPDNVDELMAEADIDGTLVGGASLKLADFSRIVRFARG